ncbi:MAG: phosphoribosylformylglycinamidine synthase I [bacterium]|nr:phosphoribosylformylglycinamidine synthase I [bacterium]
MRKIKTIILRAPGTNCDRETASAFQMAGADPEVIHINKVLRKEVCLADYHILVIPGGFSYGDDISAGRIFANKFRYKLLEEIRDFSSSRKLVLGICNGFQVLVKAGLLPFTDLKPSVTLTYNDSGKYECRWVYMKTNNASASFWIKDLPDIVRLPVAHAEGKFFTDQPTLSRIEKENLVLLQYCDEKGREAVYPANPNGALKSIAGITNPQGNIFGLMPHPERFVIRQHYPSWTREKNVVPYGFRIIENAVKFAEKNF